MEYALTSLDQNSQYWKNKGQLTSPDHMCMHLQLNLKQICLSYLRSEKDRAEERESMFLNHPWIRFLTYCAKQLQDLDKSVALSKLDQLV